jgi:hypothetical protein
LVRPGKAFCLLCTFADTLIRFAGKLSLYVAAGGIHPRATLPIVLDVGTNNEDKLKDPLYLGLRQKRASDEEVLPLVDEMMEALQKAYPNLIVQFEDFQSERAFAYLDRYQNKYRMFNDDIQGEQTPAAPCMRHTLIHALCHRHRLGDPWRLHQRGAPQLQGLGPSAVRPAHPLLWRRQCGRRRGEAAVRLLYAPGPEPGRGTPSHLAGRLQGPHHQ